MATFSFWEAAVMANDLIERDPSDLVSPTNELIPDDFSASDLAPLPGKGKGVAIVNALQHSLTFPVDVAVRCATAKVERQKQWMVRAKMEVGVYEPGDSLLHEREFRLPLMDDAYAAATQLRPMLCESEVDYEEHVITRELALAVLPVLEATSKNTKSDTNKAVWLASTLSMFIREIDRVGAALGLWKPVPRHPALLALAIGYLQRRQKWFPEQAEMYDALLLAKTKLGYKYSSLVRWLNDFDEADINLFHLDREKWQALYLAAPENIQTALQASMFVSRYLVQQPEHLKKAGQRNLQLLKLQSKDRVAPFICSNCGAGYLDYHGQCVACFEYNRVLHRRKLHTHQLEHQLETE
jgi:hypothetical protein